MDDRTRSGASARVPVPAELQPLHKYLKKRFADTVVLTFSQIEDLLGHPLPAPARAEQEWWANDGVTPSAQSESWGQAERVATVNLRAMTVTFVRQ